MTSTIEPVTESTVDDTISLMMGYFNFYEVASPDQEKLAQLIRELLPEDNPSTQFLISTDGQYVGFVTLYEVYSTMEAGKVILMNDLFVTPQYRGQGFGKELFQAAVDYTEKNGYPKMEWMTEPTNLVARRFYESMGGEPSEWVYYSIDCQ